MLDKLIKLTRLLKAKMHGQPLKQTDPKVSMVEKIEHIFNSSSKKQIQLAYSVDESWLKHIKDTLNRERLNQRQLQQEFGSIYFEVKETNQNNNWTGIEHLRVHAIASVNRSGYVREAAIDGLVSHTNPLALRFMLFRTTDWVGVIHLKAKAYVEQLLQAPDGVVMLAQNIDVLTSLKWVTRQNLQSWVNGLLQWVYKNQSLWMNTFQSWGNHTRFQLIKHWPSNIPMNDSFLNDTLITDRYEWIRLTLLSNNDWRKQISAQSWQKLSVDKSAKVRLAVIRHFNEIGDYPDQLMNEDLCSNFGAMRGFAQYIAKQRGLDIVEFYENQLRSNLKVLGALLGLTDIGAKNPSFVEQFLHSSNHKIQTAAFKCLSKSYGYDLEEFALQHFDSDNLKLRKAILIYCRKNPVDTLFKKAEQLLLSTSDLHFKKQLMALMVHMGGIKSLPGLMQMTLSEDPVIRYFAVEYLNRWKKDRIKDFTTSNEALKNVVLDTWAKCHALHEKSNLKQNPLSQLDRFIY